MPKLKPLRKFGSLSDNPRNSPSDPSRSEDFIQKQRKDDVSIC